MILPTAYRENDRGLEEPARILRLPTSARSVSRALDHFASMSFAEAPPRRAHRGRMRVAIGSLRLSR
jgi:hypothetical protein